MKLANKKGQLTLFIIIGIIAVAGVVGYFAVSRGGFDSSSVAAKKFPEINRAIENCARELFEGAVMYSASKGGVVEDLEPFVDLGELNISIWYEDGAVYYPSEEDIKFELNSFMYYAMQTCLQEWDFEEENAEFGELESEVILKDETIEWKYSQAVFIITEESSVEVKVEDRIVLDYPYGKLYDFSKNSVDNLALLDDASIIDLNSYLNSGYNISVVDMENNIRIITVGESVSRNENLFKFNYAISLI